MLGLQAPHASVAASLHPSVDERSSLDRLVIWHLSDRGDPRSVEIADRHYSRQKPGTGQFMPTGRAFVLYAPGQAVWGTSWPMAEYTKHDWAGAWICSMFRNEGAGRSSTLIRQAVAATRWRYGEPPDLGMVTFVNEAVVREKQNPGHCFIIAGFRPVGRTKKRGLLVLQLLPKKMPEPRPPLGGQIADLL